MAADGDTDTGEFEFDWGAPGQRAFGVSERQYRFVRAILRGENQTRAAEAAGYIGNEMTLRSQGSRRARSPKVMALLAAARKDAEEAAEVTGDWGELEQLMWREARAGTNPTSRVRAMELIAKHGAAPGKAEPLDQVSDFKLFEMLEDLVPDPIGVALVAVLAQTFTVDSFDPRDAEELRHWRMPRRAWKSLCADYPAIADAMTARGWGGCREEVSNGAGTGNGALRAVSRHNR